MSERIISLRGAIGEVGGRPIPFDADLAVDEITSYSRFEVAQSSSDLAVSFGPITTSSVIYIESDVAVTYKLSGTGNNSRTLNAGGRHIYMGMSETSLHVSESGSSAAVLKILIAGT
jgi:hypothetical protein